MIATLPHSNHIQTLRMFHQRIKRTRSIPSQQEFSHAEEALRELETALKRDVTNTGADTALA